MKKMNQEERVRYETRLAGRIMEYVRDQLVVMAPFFNRIILKMPVQFYESLDLGGEHPVPKGFGTDGHTVFASREKVLSYFRQEKGHLPRIYLHLLLHCVFRHPFGYEKMRREYWDFAADAAVEAVILNMHQEAVTLPDDNDRRMALNALKEKCGRLTAESIYHYMCQHEEEAEQFLGKAVLYRQDLHEFWMMDVIAGMKKKYPKNPHPGVNKVSQQWKQLGTAVQLDMQVFEKNQGLAPGSMTENLEEALHRDQHDYGEFLKKFAVTNEQMHINPDEFDYIYYTYGMDLYGNMPLIEPLEYREEKRIHDFVIAIDTSGSCQGRTVRGFLDRTYSILKSTESFFHEVNIHIIQCDARIQEDVKITDREEFEAYMKQIKIKGFGGTDFRPVFEHVDQMIRNGEFEDLKGLIYFTDGMGIFPEKMPPYKTAFVFVGDRATRPKIPAWAIRLTLKEEDIEYQ